MLWSFILDFKWNLLRQKYFSFQNSITVQIINICHICCHDICYVTSRYRLHWTNFLPGTVVENIVDCKNNQAFKCRKQGCTNNPRIPISYEQAKSEKREMKNKWSKIFTVPKIKYCWLENSRCPIVKYFLDFLEIRALIFSDIKLSLFWIFHYWKVAN